MYTISDPALFFSIYLRKNPVDVGEDPRMQVLRNFDTFIEKYALEPDLPTKRRFGRAADIDLVALAESSPTFEILLQCHTEYPETRTGTYYECLAYVYHDALILQIMITKFRNWSGAFRAGWEELTDSLRSCFNGGAFTTAGRVTLGMSAVYWSIADSHSEIGSQKELFRSIVEESNLWQTATDLGAPLWYCPRLLFPDCGEISQDLWMLITPRSAESQVNQRFYQPRVNGPPDFAIAALARHKMVYEGDEFRRERERMQRIEKDLEQRLDEIVDVQRRLGAELEELRSDKAVAFQRKLAEASAVLADYGQSVGLLRALRRTVVVNLRVFLIHCVALVTSRGAEEVARSVDQEAAAARWLANSRRDEILGREMGGFQFLSRELDSSIDYGSSIIERRAMSVQSASNQLRIAGERELGEIAHHLSIDSAAVVASLVAVIATEMIIRPAEIHTPEEAIGRWSLALALVAGSFALTQILSSGCRGKHLERWSAAVALGLFAGFLASRYLTEHLRFYHLHEIVALVAGALLGWFGHLRLKEYRARSARERSHQSPSNGP